jgi:glutamyl-tRNA reductase
MAGCRRGSARAGRVYHRHAAPTASAACGERWQANTLTFESLPAALLSADIVITSTGAPHMLIKLPLVQAVMQQRPERPLVLIDIAVPRDVDPDVNQLPNVSYDIDDLAARLNGSLAGRQQQIPQVEAIIAAEADAFMAWLQSLEIMPVISDLRAKANSIRQAEVDKALRQLKGWSETDRQCIEAMSEALVNKLLHDATLRLKAEANNGHAAEYAAAVRHLFALSTTPHALSD